MASLIHTPDPNKSYALAGTTVDSITDTALESRKLNVTAPLMLVNGPNGPTLSLETAIATFAYGIVKGPTEDGAKGRCLVKLINGPADNDPTGDLEAENLGVIPDDDDATIIEAWGSGAEGLAVDLPVWGWHIQNRPDAKQSRQILLLAGVSALPLGQYQGMIAQMVTDNIVGYDFLVSHAMEPNT